MSCENDMSSIGRFACAADELNSFMHTKQLPKELQAKVLQYREMTFNSDWCGSLYTFVFTDWPRRFHAC